MARESSSPAYYGFFRMKFGVFLKNFSELPSDLACACRVAATAQAKGSLLGSPKDSAVVEISGNFDPRIP